MPRLLDEALGDKKERSVSVCSLFSARPGEWCEVVRRFGAKTWCEDIVRRHCAKTWCEDVVRTRANTAFTFVKLIRVSGWRMDEELIGLSTFSTFRVYVCLVDQGEWVAHGR